jgi:O-antigen/teichoic acid export membrane protein
MSKVIKNTFIYMSGRLLPRFAMFLLLPVYTAFLTTAQYGIVNSMMVLNTLLLVIFTLAIDRSIYRLYFDYKSEKGKKDFLGTVTVSLFIISTIFLVILFLLKDLVTLIYQSIDFYPFFVIAILTSYVSIFHIVPKIYYQINNKAGTYIGISLLQFVSSTMFILLFVVVLKKGVWGMLMGYLIGEAILLPLFLYIILKKTNICFKTKILKECLQFSLPIIPTALSAWILNLSDRIFIERFLTLSEVGIYSLGCRLSSLIAVVSSAFHFAYYPLYYSLANSEDQERAKRKLYLYNNSCLIIMILMSFVVALFSKNLIEIFFPLDYYDSYKIMLIISFSYLLTAASSLLGLSFYQEKKTKELMFITVFGAVLNIILNFTLIPIFGMFGAAYATNLSFLVLFIIKYIYSKKCYFIPFDWKRIMSYFVPLSIITSAIYLININNIWLDLIIKIVVFLIVSLLVIWNNRLLICVLLKKKFSKYYVVDKLLQILDNNQE